MTTRKRIVAILSAVFLTLAIAVTAVAAGGPVRGFAARNSADTTASTTTTSATTAAITAAPLDTTALGVNLTDLAQLAAPGQGGDPQARCQSFVTALSGNLKVTPAQLQDALKQTMLQQIDAALAAGTLTAEQAQAARDRINAATGDLCANLGALAGHGNGGPMGGMMGGDRGHGMGMELLQGDILNAAATYFGISADQFKQDLPTAGSLQGVAAKYGKDNVAGKAGLQTALANALRQSLTTKGVATATIDQTVTAFTQGFDRLYTAPLGKFGPGGMPNTNPGMPNPGQRTPRPSAAPSAAPTN